jgi:hypothetical protein
MVLKTELAQRDKRKGWMNCCWAEMEGTKEMKITWNPNWPYKVSWLIIGLKNNTRPLHSHRISSQGPCLGFFSKLNMPISAPAMDTVELARCPPQQETPRDLPHFVGLSKADQTWSVRGKQHLHAISDDRWAGNQSLWLLGRLGKA